MKGRIEAGREGRREEGREVVKRRSHWRGSQLVPGKLVENRYEVEQTFFLIYIYLEREVSVRSGSCLNDRTKKTPRELKKKKKKKSSSRGHDYCFPHVCVLFQLVLVVLPSGWWSVSSVASWEPTYAWRGNQCPRLSGWVQMPLSRQSQPLPFVPSVRWLLEERESIEDTRKGGD